MKRALTIAGSDSGGGAGIQADLKTFTALGVYGMSVLTAITAQNTVGVQGVKTLDADFVALQMDSVLQDIGTDAVKTGMLSNQEIVEVVASKISDYNIHNLVVDPVMVAKGGDHLLQRDAMNTLKEKLIPVSFIITPNMEEAEVITGRQLDSDGKVEQAAKYIYDLGVPYVLIKGGHRTGDAVDVLFDGEDYHRFVSPRIETKNTHGTGCTFSAAITAGLALGKNVHQAVAEAKAYITDAIRYSLNLGSGYGPTNHLVQNQKRAARYEVIKSIQEALKMMENWKLAPWIPETQTNLAVAVPYAESFEDVAAVPGRLIRWGDSFRTLSAPEFGASKSMASMVLTAMKWDPSARAAMNIRYSEANLDACREAGFSMIEFVWPQPGESGGVKKLNQLIKEYVEVNGQAPDIIYNRGGWGKEAHIEFFGKDAQDVTAKIKKVMKMTEEK